MKRARVADARERLPELLRQAKIPVAAVQEALNLAAEALTERAAWSSWTSIFKRSVSKQ